MELLLPSVGFFADVLGNHGPYVAPASKPSVRVVAVVELALGVQVVLRQRVSVALQSILGHRLAGLAVEAAFCRFTEIFVVGGHGSGKILPRKGQRSRLVGEQEAKWPDPLSVRLLFDVSIEPTEQLGGGGCVAAYGRSIKLRRLADAAASLEGSGEKTYPARVAPRRGEAIDGEWP